MKFEYYFVTGIFYAWHNYLFPNNARVEICPYFEYWVYKRGDKELTGKYVTLLNSFKVDKDIPQEVKVALEDLYGFRIFIH